MSAAAVSPYEVPRVPASVGALIFDPADQLLVLKPNYKKGWTIPGGQMESNGESPWEACQRETREECGLAVTSGRLVCVDFRRPKRGRPGGAAGALAKQCVYLEDGRAVPGGSG